VPPWSVDRSRYKDRFRASNGKKKLVRRPARSRKVMTCTTRMQLLIPFMDSRRDYFKVMNEDQDYEEHLSKAKPEKCSF
jgi:hypothetical protein